LVCPPILPHRPPSESHSISQTCLPPVLPACLPAFLTIRVACLPACLPACLYTRSRGGTLHACMRSKMAPQHLTARVSHVHMDVHPDKPQGRHDLIGAIGSIGATGCRYRISHLSFVCRQRFRCASETKGLWGWMHRSAWGSVHGMHRYCVSALAALVVRTPLCTRAFAV
jgi:hypothetical protein